MRFALFALLLSAPAAQAAPTLSMPPASARTIEEHSALGSYALPTGPWAQDALPTIRTEGEVTQTAWRIEEGDISTGTVFTGLRDQLQAEGFEVLFDCESDGCGGFDFRFALPVLPEPDMHVDLGDFRYLSARRGSAPRADYVSLLVSRSADSAYVQMTRIGPVLDPSVPLATAAPAIAAPSGTAGAGTIETALLDSGKTILGDLSFASGSPDLQPGDYASLDALAAFLKANPDKTLALVGHTDAQGSLASNVALSRARAQSVLAYLVTELGCDPAQLSADGIGYLSPLASNLTDEGRTKNRRVEALLTSTR